MNNTIPAFLFGFCCGLIFLGLLHTFTPSNGEVDRAIKAGCGQYDTQTGEFKYINMKE